VLAVAYILLKAWVSADEPKQEPAVTGEE
jgi:hypothetical protein